MKQDKRLQTIDGESLMNLPLKPLNFVVDSLLSQGLHILAGSPKVGKSWLALWLSVMVAKGESVWGMSVKQGTTLYLCLEDSTLRIQNRLYEITEDTPADVHFSTESDILGKGLEQQVGNLVALATQENDILAYREQLKDLMDETNLLKEKRDRIQIQREKDHMAAGRIEIVVTTLNQAPAELQWDESIIRQLVDTVKVISKEKIIVYLRSGVQIEQEISE